MHELQAVLQTAVAATACAARWLTQQSEAGKPQSIAVFEVVLRGFKFFYGFFSVFNGFTEHC